MSTWSCHGGVPSLYGFVSQCLALFRIEEWNWWINLKKNSWFSKNPDVGWLCTNQNVCVEHYEQCQIQHYDKFSHVLTVDVAPVSQRNYLQMRDQFVHSSTGISALDCMIVLWFGCWSSKTGRFRLESQWILLSENADLIFRLWSLFTALVLHYLLGAS